MIWAGIVGDEVTGPLEVHEGIKLNSDSYCALLEVTFFKWYKPKVENLKRTACSFTAMLPLMRHGVLLTFWREKD